MLTRIPSLSAALAGTSAAAAGGEGGAAALEATIAPALAACDAALARCIKLTGGTGLPALARVLDRAVQQYVAALQAAVSALRARVAGGGGGEGGGGGGDAGGEGAEAVLPLLTVASQAVQRLALLEAGLRQAAAEVAQPLLEASDDAAAAAAPTQQQPDRPLRSAAELRLASQPAQRQQLAAFAANASSGAQLLPLARSAAAELEAGVGGAVLEALAARPRAQLAALPRLPEWQQRGGGGGLALPTFSAYPLAYVTSGALQRVEAEVWRWCCHAGVPSSFLVRPSQQRAGIPLPVLAPAPTCACLPSWPPQSAST